MEHTHCDSRSMAKSLILGVLVLATYGVIGNEGVRDTSETNGHCRIDQFRCFNNKCINRSWYCDSADDCGDNSDEMYCSLQHDRYGRYAQCPTHAYPFFQCTSQNRCIPRIWRCDQQPDCSDGSDEVECSAPETVPGHIVANQKLIRWFLDRRQSSFKTNKWGESVQRIAIALFLSDKRFFTPGNATTEEITYELGTQLLSRFAMDVPMSPNELALHINALLVSCFNPKDFYGRDLVSELREEVDSQNFTNPFLSLTLCNADDSMTQKDVTRVVEAFNAKLRPSWTEMQALAVMALSCMSWKKPDLVVDQKILEGMTSKLKSLQHQNGSIENLKTTALVLQALIAAGRVEDEDFDELGALKLIVGSQESSGSYGNLLNSYYLLPVFSSLSLVNISSDHCAKQEDGNESVTRYLSRGVATHHIRLSLWVGDDVDAAWTLTLRVPVNSTLYSIWEMAAKLDSRYRAKYNVINGKPFVYSIVGVQDDPERGKFWYSCYLEDVNDDKPKLIESSPVDVIPKANQEFAMWYRSGKWNDITVVPSLVSTEAVTEDTVTVA